MITLSAVALLTILILVFFSNSLFNRQISVANSNRVKADQLTRAALEIVTGEIRNEIADPQYSTPSSAGNPILYQPIVSTTTSNAIPRRVGVVAGSSTTNTTNVFKVSASNSSIDPGTYARPMGSMVSISAVSRNSRYYSQDRWFGSGGPQLGTNGPQPVPGSTLPTWVYMTRGGVQTQAQGSDLTTVANQANAGYVIGRFAYTVYDQGGLMDANVAGYPTAAYNGVNPITSITTPAFKSSLAFADLGQVLQTPPVAGTGTVGNSLVSWRNASTGMEANTFGEWATGLAPASGTANAAALAAAASGHLSAVASDNAFFSRQDLLLAAQDSVAGLTLPLAGSLTHFSRTLNAPSWAPPVVAGATDINPDLSGGVRFPNAATITHYDDNGVASANTVSAGDPIIQRRFSLAKLGWLLGVQTNASDTTNGLKPGISVAAAQACFGLTWDAGNERWNYQDYPIKTLKQVAAVSPAREPNFFELLKAGITLGSTGLAGSSAVTNNTLSDGKTQLSLDGNADLQILRIGANILDMASADNYPSTITLPVGGLSIRSMA